jgi:hypothetical protein
VLWLLRGCPRRWFAPGKTIAVENAPTLFGKMGLRTRCDDRTISVDIDAPSWEPPRELRVVVRHPQRRAMTGATVNGKKCPVEGETVTIPTPRGNLRLVCSFRMIHGPHNGGKAPMTPRTSNRDENSVSP